MTIEDFKLTCIKDKNVLVWTVWMDDFPGMVVQVDNYADAPNELAKLFITMLYLGFDKNIHSIIETDIFNQTKER